MKTVTVNNLTFQFDHNDDNPSRKDIQDFIDVVNRHLAHEFSDFCPAIMREIKSEDIEVHPLGYSNEENNLP